MGKKRMVAQEFNTVDVKDGQPVESPVKNDAAATVLDRIEDASGGIVDIKADIKAKLETFEKMEKTVSDLSRENEALKEKLAEYIETISELRNASAEETAKEAPDADAKLAAEIKALREENDSYLMRISELTFDNARLTASLSEISCGKCQPARQVAPDAAKQQRGQCAYSNPYRNNGYGAWN